MPIGPGRWDRRIWRFFGRWRNILHRIDLRCPRLLENALTLSGASSQRTYLINDLFDHDSALTDVPPVVGVGVSLSYPPPNRCVPVTWRALPIHCRSRNGQNSNVTIRHLRRPTTTPEFPLSGQISHCLRVNPAISVAGCLAVAVRPPFRTECHRFYKKCLKE